MYGKSTKTHPWTVRKSNKSKRITWYSCLVKNPKIMQEKKKNHMVMRKNNESTTVIPNKHLLIEAH